MILRTTFLGAKNTLTYTLYMHIYMHIYIYYCCSESLLRFRFPGATQHNFVLKFHPTFSVHYPPTFPKLLPLHITVPPHHSPPFPLCYLTPLTHLSHHCHSTPLAQLSHPPNSPLSHLSQLTSPPRTSRHL